MGAIIKKTMVTTLTEKEFYLKLGKDLVKNFEDGWEDYYKQFLKNEEKENVDICRR